MPAPSERSAAIGWGRRRRAPTGRTSTAAVSAPLASASRRPGSRRPGSFRQSSPATSGAEPSERRRPPTGRADASAWSARSTAPRRRFRRPPRTRYTTTDFGQKSPPGGIGWGTNRTPSPIKASAGRVVGHWCAALSGSIEDPRHGRLLGDACLAGRLADDVELGDERIEVEQRLGRPRRRSDPRARESRPIHAALAPTTHQRRRR